MDGNAVVCPLKRLCVRVDPASPKRTAASPERGADRLAQRLRVEAHGVLLRFPLRLELALGRICVLTEGVSACGTTMHCASSPAPNSSFCDCSDATGSSCTPVTSSTDSSVSS